MKRILTLLAIILVSISCGREKEDEKAIKDVMESFYEAVNSRDFKTLSKISSSNMKKSLEFMETFGEDMVKYENYTVKSVNISGNKANAKVIATDQFGNTTDCVWNLTKAGGVWLVDVFNMSSADKAEEKPTEQKEAK